MLSHDACTNATLIIRSDYHSAQTNERPPFSALSLDRVSPISVIDRFGLLSRATVWESYDESRTRSIQSTRNPGAKK